MGQKQKLILGKRYRLIILIGVLPTNLENWDSSWYNQDERRELSSCHGKDRLNREAEWVSHLHFNRSPPFALPRDWSEAGWKTSERSRIWGPICHQSTFPTIEGSEELTTAMWNEKNIHFQHLFTCLVHNFDFDLNWLCLCQDSSLQSEELSLKLLGTGFLVAENDKKLVGKIVEKCQNC